MSTQVTDTDFQVNRRSPWLQFKRGGWRHIVAWIIIVYALFPILYVVSASLSSEGTLTGSNQLFQSIGAENYQNLLTDEQHPYMRWFINSMIVSSVTAIGTVLMGAAAAFAFSRYRFQARRPGLIALLIVQMFPQLLAFVAIFLLMFSIKSVYPWLGLNSLPGLILIYLGGSLGSNTFLMFGFFNTVPTEIDKAAVIDGASHAQVYWRIVLPLITPSLVVVGMLAFVASFSDFLMAQIVLQDPQKWTLAVGLYQFVSVQFGENWGVFTAGAVIAAAPVVLLFIILQRYIVSGITGAVKG
ncbi:MAG: sugar ABC transporter permease [Corynebacterium sp.]|uniref:sugar ABC transporter permease n=1 Tax=Corynebacterium sp. TaxID=1720 RepID=UPI0026E0A69C|nr:sugar ABC transporter permease [Corynebacterium sp.]MDO5670926.1 sugar ABC transporter permease [Corynebacterium sp.]